MNNREMTPDLAQNIHMSIYPTDTEEFKIAADKARYYTNGIKSLAPQLGNKAPRLDALLDKLGESRCINLFVMPAKPWPVPARLFSQYDERFGQYFDLVVNEFQVRHTIFGNGTKYSFREQDDNDLTIFLERKSPEIQDNPKYHYTSVAPA